MNDKSEFLVNTLSSVFDRYCGHNDSWIFCGRVSTDKYHGYRFRFEDYYSNNPNHQELISEITDYLNDCFIKGTWCLECNQDYVSQSDQSPFYQSSYIDLIFQEDVHDENHPFPIIDPMNSRIDFSGCYSEPSNKMEINSDQSEMQIDTICQGIKEINLNGQDDHLKYHTSTEMYYYGH